MRPITVSVHNDLIGVDIDEDFTKNLSLKEAEKLATLLEYAIQEVNDEKSKRVAERYATRLQNRIKKWANPQVA